MTNENCREVFRQLVSMLNDREMNWVVDEANEVLRAGKLIDEPIGNSSGKSSREFRTTREYTSQEALLILIDSIESVVVHTAFIEEEVTNFFRKEGERFKISPEVRFLSEEESEPTIFSYDSSIYRAEQATQLERLLEQLRSEVSR
jgi:hypothetical protein